MRQTFEVDSKHKHMLNKLNHLEASIQEESEQHDLLLHQFINAVKSRAEYQLTSSTTTSPQTADKSMCNELFSQSIHFDRSHFFPR